MSLLFTNYSDNIALPPMRLMIVVRFCALCSMALKS